MEKLSIPKVYGVVTVGKRGQVVIPAQIRKDYQINPGDKLFVIAKDPGPVAFVPTQKFSKFLEHTAQLAEIIKSSNVKS
jgi:AbrB family looped-hinge helix DNA binding protein